MGFVCWGSLGSGIPGIGKGVCKGAEVGRGMKEALFLSCRGKTLGPCLAPEPAKHLICGVMRPLGLGGCTDLLFFSLSQAPAGRGTGSSLPLEGV